MKTGSSRNEIPDAAETVHDPQAKEAYGLLAQANLLRVRGQWDEAVSLCMTAMELLPGFSAAQSLLGDIHECRGHKEDAIRWYQMALDSNPDSHADRRKLESLLRADRIVPSLEDVHPMKPQEPVEAPYRTAGFALPVALRIAAIVCAVSIVGLTILAVFKQRARGNAAAGAPLLYSAPPVLVGSGTTPLPTPSQTTTDRPLDPSEESLLDSLKSALLAQNAPVRADDIMSDPRSGAIVTTVVLTDTSPPSSREAVLKIAATVAQAGTHIQAASAYNTWTVRILAPESAGTAPSLLFIGDAQRATVGALPTDLTSVTAEQLTPLFANTWWSSSAPP